MEQKYYICKHCGNIVLKAKDSGVPVVCCGEPCFTSSQPKMRSFGRADS